MKLGDFCLNVVHFLRSKICYQRLSCQFYSTVVRFVRLIRLWLYIRNFRSCQSAAMHLLCHNHTFLDPLFTACLQHCPFSSFSSSLTHTQHSTRHLIVYIEKIYTPSSPPGQRLHTSDTCTHQKHTTTAAMNIQPPVHDRFIVTPGATQRDAVPTARKPSLVPGGQPNPVRSHAVAVCCSRFSN